MSDTYTETLLDQIQSLAQQRDDLREALATVVREARIARQHVVPPLQPSIAENLDDAIDIGLQALANLNKPASGE